MLIVIDTNILVSAFWAKNSNPARILELVLAREIKPCFSNQMMDEYKDVMLRPHFGFHADEVEAVLDTIRLTGYSVVPAPQNIPFTDETDRKFYEVARFCCAKLITGNKKHFPDAPGILTPAEFLTQYNAV